MNKTRSTLIGIVFFYLLFSATSVCAGEKTDPTGTININTATEVELAYLPGLGPSKAKAIVASRAKRPFKKVEGILRVKGIGRKTFKKLRPYLRISGATTITSKIVLPKE